MAHVDVFAAAFDGFAGFVLGVLQGELHDGVAVVVFQEGLFLIVEEEVVDAGGVAFGVVAVFGQRVFDEFVGAAVLVFGFVFVNLPVQRAQVEVFRQGVFAPDLFVALVVLGELEDVSQARRVYPGAFAVEEVAVVVDVAAVVERFVCPEGAAVGEGGVVQCVFVVKDVRVVDAQHKQGFFDGLPDGGVFAAADELGADFARLGVGEDARRGKGQVGRFGAALDEGVEGVFDLCGRGDAAFVVMDVHAPAAPLVEDDDVACGVVRAVEGVFVFYWQRAAGGATQDFPLAVAGVGVVQDGAQFAVLVGVVDAGKGVGEVGDALQSALWRFPVDFHRLVAGERQAAAVGKAHAAPVVDEPGVGCGEIGALFEQALEFGGFEMAEVFQRLGAVGVGFVVHQRAQPLEVGGEGVVQARQGQGFHDGVGFSAGSSMWSMRR